MKGLENKQSLSRDNILCFRSIQKSTQYNNSYVPPAGISTAAPVSCVPCRRKVTHASTAFTLVLKGQLHEMFDFWICDLSVSFMGPSRQIFRAVFGL
jgi:hypothetical protein